MTRVAIQATAVEIGGRAILIEGASGTGKSSLALALIDRGARLIGDDGVLLEARDGQLFVLPHPNTRGLIEVRNLGLLRFPTCDECPVSLALVLDADAPRFIEDAAQEDRLGIALPVVSLWPDSPVLPIKAELALERYGLPAS